MRSQIYRNKLNRKNSENSSYRAVDKITKGIVCIEKEKERIYAS